MYLLFAFAYLCIKWHIPLLIPSSTINSISQSVNNSNCTFVFFLDMLAMLILVMIRNEMGRTDTL